MSRHYSSSWWFKSLVMVALWGTIILFLTWANWACTPEVTFTPPHPPTPVWPH